MAIISTLAEWYLKSNHFLKVAISQKYSKL